MTVADCIRAKAAAGRVNPEKAARLAQLFDDQLAELRNANAVRPEEQAADLVTRIIEHETRTKKRARLMQMKRQAEIRERIAASDDPLEAALAIFDFDPTRRQDGLNVTMLRDAVRGQAHARMADFVDRFGSKAAGLDVAAPGVVHRRTAGLRDVVRALFGEDAGSAEAKVIAEGVGEAMEYLRQTFNAVGGNIPKRADWGLPQRHSRRLIAAADKESWIDFILARTDRAKMTDLETGQPFTESKLRQVAGENYDQIVTDGLVDVKPGFQLGRNLAVKRAQRRFWVFRDADAWLEYQDRFGEGDAFSNIAAHINGMSRDIALMKTLGPNPTASVELLERLVAQRIGEEAIATTGDKAARLAGRVARGQPAIRNLYATVSGEIHEPANLTLANISAANRNIVTSAMLGGAFFSALADRAFTKATESLNGIPAGRSMMTLLKLMTPGNKADRQLAARLGFINEIALGSAIGQARYMGEVVGPEWSRKIADVVLRLSLLSPWTNWGSTAFGMEFLGFVTEQVGKRLDEMPEPLQRAFKAYGIGEGDWDLMRAVPLWRDDKTGATFLRPQDIIGSVEDAGPLFDRHFDAAMKLQSMILTETEFAVPKKTARTTAALSGGSRPGQVVREILDNALLFKSFPITIVLTHLRRAVLAQMPVMTRARMVAHMGIGTAVLGVMGEQLSQISKGKDPLDMDPTTDQGRAVWLKGLARGGGLGIFGDFIFSDVNRFGGGLQSTFLGPVFGSELPGAAKLTIGNLQELVKDGKATNAGRDLVKFAKLMTPGRSLWHLTLAMDRMVFDEAQKMIDPNYAKSFRDIQRRARREFDQQFFSPPGSGFPPARGPRF